MAVTDLIPRIRRNTSVARREGTDPLVSFYEQMNQLFEDVWRDFDVPGFPTASSFAVPRVEVSDSEREVKVEVELPGLDEKDIEVLLQDGMLTIRGEKKSETEEKSRRMSERFYGRFERRIALPAEVQDVQEDRVSASFKKGVLTVSLPKSEESAQKVKRIAISGK